ncbi:chaplin [Streptomyces pathocidini]|uniref:Chaplin n=1 Tax=Streptomyces pathocidini TaxID=1650571 RepID=A0ABW7UQT1_9ACTN|nr:chaplin [Streptomyces pathocidini]
MSRITKAAAVTVAAGAVLAGTAGVAAADGGTNAVAAGSPGVLSGNVVQVPVNIPVNLCGNTISVIGILNPAFGNTCLNADTYHDEKKIVKTSEHRDYHKKDKKKKY